MSNRPYRHRSGATVATRWFTARRGLVVGLLTASSATGQLVFLPLIAGIDRTFRLACSVGFCLRPSRTRRAARAHSDARPSERSRPAIYGETVVTPAPPAGGGLASLLSSPFAALKEAVRVPLFWILFGTFFICGCSTSGLIQTHFITLCADYGAAAVAAASVLAMMGVFDFVGTIGWLAVRPFRQSLAVVLSITGCAGFRCSTSRSQPLRSTACRCLRCSTASTGSRRCRRRSSSPPTVSDGERAPFIIFGCDFCRPSGLAPRLQRSAPCSLSSHQSSASYLPAFFVAGALCLIAAALGA